MRLHKSLLTVALWLGASAGFGQQPCPDFLTHLKSLLSEDAAVRRQADQGRDRTADCLAELQTKDKEYIDQAIIPLVLKGLASAEPQVRVAATGIPAYLAILGKSTPSGVLLEKVVPSLMEHFEDPGDPERDQDYAEMKIRQNSIITVAGLNPAPPAIATEPLLRALDGRYEEAAFTGLVRIDPMSEPVALRLKEKLEARSGVAKGNLIHAVAAAIDLHPFLLSAVVESLRSDDDYVVEKAAGTLAQLGPRAAGATPELHKLARDPRLTGNSILAGEVARALASIGRDR